MDTRFDAHQPLATQAYEAVRPELEAMRPEDVEPIRHDIMDAMVTALGAAAKVQGLRERARAKFGEEAAQVIDRLESDARACGKAHAIHLLTLHGTDVDDMAGRLSQTRAVLLLEVQALIAIGALPSVVVAELIGGTSYKGLCLDVLQLTTALRAKWPEVESKTGVTLLEVDQAEALAARFSTVIGENEQGTVSSPTADMRRRAYTRFVRTYDEVRRLATFFHWETGDADTVLPPLGANRRTSAPADEVESSVGTPASQTPVAPGMPGGSPFITPT
jgi:hypothetical protein